MTPISRGPDGKGRPFQPEFKDFQKDIEKYLVSVGKCQKHQDGTMEFRGFFEAQERMFAIYLREGAVEPLVAHFKGWNWEHSYNEFLMLLTDTLIGNGDWNRLRTLWNGVISKRRRLYNQVWKIEKDQPGTLPSKTVRQASQGLLETLERVKGYAQKLGAVEDIETYSAIQKKVEAGRRG